MAYDPDRLSRNLADLLLLDNEFTRYGAKLEFITQEMDTSPEGKMFFAIRGAVGQYEREKIKEGSMRDLRVRSGKARCSAAVTLHLAIATIKTRQPWKRTLRRPKP